jgi:hypothetical protein
MLQFISVEFNVFNDIVREMSEISIQIQSAVQKKHADVQSLDEDTFEKGGTHLSINALRNIG